MRITSLLSQKTQFYKIYYIIRDNHYKYCLNVIIRIKIHDWYIQQHTLLYQLLKASMKYRYQRIFSIYTLQDPGNPLCRNTDLGKCFLAQQNLDIDNCWFTISKDDLTTSSATVEIIAYNQALLTVNTSFSVRQNVYFFIINA